MTEEKTDSFTNEVFKRLTGKNMQDLKQMGEENLTTMPLDWFIYERERAEELFLKEMGFSISGRQRLIIDYDESYDKVLVRRERSPVGWK